jgi:hypothetical protein
MAQFLKHQKIARYGILSKLSKLAGLARFGVQNETNLVLLMLDREFNFR